MIPEATEVSTATKQQSASKIINFSGEGEIDKFHFTHSHNRLQKNPYDAGQFKALDFSDVAIYGKSDSLNSTNDDRFRHFHQMRLYIDNTAAYRYHHGEGKSGKILIVSNLPEKISYALNSQWKEPLDFGDPTSNLLLQLAGSSIGENTPNSSVMRAQSFKIWTKTEPLTLDLTIPVIDDAKNSSGTNLVEALEILGSLCLPTRSDAGLGFYIPPPSPLNMTIKYSTSEKDAEGKYKAKTTSLANGNYSRIVLQLGGVLLVDNCIIESVSVNYPDTKAQILHDYSVIGENKPNFGTTKDQYLHPLLAEVRIKISTLEALTASTYSKMLWAKPQSGEGTLTWDSTPITDYYQQFKDWITARDAETTTTE